MVRLDAGLMTVALAALFVSCSGGTHEPEPPAVVPEPAVQPRRGPDTPATPSPKAEPKLAPRDSGESAHYPWPSGPIASL